MLGLKFVNDYHSFIHFNLTKKVDNLRVYFHRAVRMHPFLTTYFKNVMKFGMVINYETVKTNVTVSLVL